MRSKSVSSPSAKQRSAKKPSTSARSRTDWTKLRSKAQGKVSVEHPEADIAHIMRGVVRRGLEPLPAKASISLRLDQDVLEWFKAQGPGYQTRINSVLRAFRDASV
ncbi:MAG: BrnA antitoxin family protein [Parahaliea sp.]